MTDGVFQSTRGPEGPRDPSESWRARPKTKFQSTRGPEGPRDPRGLLVLLPLDVSIHARPRGATRHDARRMPLNHCWFQSTRGPEGPRDWAVWPMRPLLNCFNPRAAPRGHATRIANDPDAEARFQSTRGPEGPRDDTIASNGYASYEFQSTRGPEGPRDPAQGIGGRGAARFNPRAAPRGHATYEVARQLVLGLFQSTRGPEGPRDGVHVERGLLQQVSIHARPRGATRPRFTATGTRAMSFNPRAAPRGHATVVALAMLGHDKFQSTRGPEGPRDRVPSSRASLR